MTLHVQFNSDAAIIAIGEGLCARTLPKVQWTHAAHIAAAVWVLQRYPRPEADDRMRRLIRAYNESTGVVNTDSSGYHETITIASLRGVTAWLAANPDQSLSASCNALLATALGRPDWLLTHWSQPRLFCAEARRGWLDPDLRPLPF